MLRVARQREREADAADQPGVHLEEALDLLRVCVHRGSNARRSDSRQKVRARRGVKVGVRSAVGVQPHSFYAIFAVALVPVLERRAEGLVVRRIDERVVGVL